MLARHRTRWLVALIAVAATSAGGLVVAQAQEASLPPGVGAPLEGAAPLLNAASDLGRTEQYTGITPCRIFDTRDQSGPLADGARSFDVTGALEAQGGSNTCGIPDNATSIAINLTGISTGSTGFVRGWAAGGPQAQATLLNFGPAINVSNQVNIPLCTGGACPDAFTLRAWGSADIVGDAVGYFTAPMYAFVNSDGLIGNRHSGVKSFSATGVGQYSITFEQNLDGCSVQGSNQLFTVVRSISVDHSGATVFVRVKDVANSAKDSQVYVTVAC